MPLDLDDSRWPVLVATLSGEAIDEEMDEYFAWMDRWLETGEPHAVVLDFRAGGANTAKQRRRIAAWIKQRSGQLAATRAGVVCVTESHVVRGIVTAIRWLIRPPYPWTVTSTMAQANVWVAERLRERAP